MNVLVTGGAGFIGSFLCERLISLGCFATILNNLDPQFHPNGVPSYIPSDAKLVVANVCDTDALGSEIEGAESSGSSKKGQSDLYVDHSGQVEAELSRFGLVRQGRERLF